ncbi:MAG: fibronectin type III domain-containing protein [Flavobacteriales bacterium]
MATLKTGLAQLTDEALVAKAEFVIAKLTANAATFTTPNPTLLVLTGAKNALATAITNAEDGGRSAHDAKRTAYTALKELLTQEAGYVTSVAAGDSAKILDGGYEVRKEREPSNVPLAPVMVDARTSDYTGMVDLDWKGKSAVYYLVFMTDKDPSTGNVTWTQVANTTKSRSTVGDLESAKFYWFRVIAVNAAGQSPASDVIMGRAA